MLHLLLVVKMLPVSVAKQLSIVVRSGSENLIILEVDLDFGNSGKWQKRGRLIQDTELQ